MREGGKMSYMRSGKRMVRSADGQELRACLEYSCSALSEGQPQTAHRLLRFENGNVVVERVEILAELQEEISENMRHMPRSRFFQYLRKLQERLCERPFFPREFSNGIGEIHPTCIRLPQY